MPRVNTIPKGLKNSPKPGHIRFPNGCHQLVKYASYHACKEAGRNPEISKYYQYAPKPRFCGFELDKVATVNTQRVKGNMWYDTEHVFEPQTMSRFLAWLGSDKKVEGGAANGWETGTVSWVISYIVDKATAFKLDNKQRLGTRTGGDPVFDVLVFGFPRSDARAPLGQVRGSQLLTVLEHQIDMAKGKVFEAVTWHTDKTIRNAQTPDAQHDIRLKAAVFRYLHLKPKGDKAIWDKWMKVANWIDLVFYEFDEQYKWGTNQGEPTAPQGQTPSLRALWAHWIDNIELPEHEERMRKWSDNAAKDFKALFKASSQNQPLLDWYNAAFEKGGTKSKKKPHKDLPDGFTSKAKLKFPRPNKSLSGALALEASEYGAWGMVDFTIDAAGNKTNLPAPTRLH